MISTFVTTEEFRRQIQEHRARVLRNALLVTSEFLEQFPNLKNMSVNHREALCRSYFGLHDLPKLMSRQQLAEWNYFNQTSIFEDLLSVYGQRLEQRPRFIEDLNQIESEMKKTMIESQFSYINTNLREQLTEELQLIEWIADITDTMLSRGPELGVQFSQQSPVDYFRDRQAYQAAMIARWLTNKIIKH